MQHFPLPGFVFFGPGSTMGHAGSAHFPRPPVARYDRIPGGYGLTAGAQYEGRPR
jgi:hypothetical protein